MNSEIQPMDGSERPDPVTGTGPKVPGRKSLKIEKTTSQPAADSSGITEGAITGSEAETGHSNNIRRGSRPGDRYIRVIRPSRHEVYEASLRHVQLTEENALGQRGLFRFFKRLVIGRPISSAHSSHERLGIIRALAIFASDALSSVAYATEAGLFVLVTAVSTSAPIQYIIPISIVICLLIALVVNSYRQTVHAYPAGGGSYIVSKDNLGTNPGLIAAAAILIDYTLTVAVSVAAGVAAITSAFPELNGNQIIMGVALIVLIALGNLRGIRESGSIFAIPTYLFIFSLLGLIIFGTIKIVTGNYVPITDIKDATTEIHAFNTHSMSIFLLLQAFAAGCTALTGVEAISDGVQAFKKPEARNAATTLIIMGGLLIIFFMGISFLAYHLGALPDDPASSQYETVISKIGRNLLDGNSPFYYIIQASTALILILAANTAFSDFPRLAYFLARDKFMPSLFLHRGDKLAYTTGILVLAVLASFILAIFNGHTEALIPLYAVGVFLAFTLSQTGMVVHWQKKKREGVPGVWQGQFFNLIGAIATGIVLVIIVITKFLAGAWLVILLIPVIFLFFKAINRHYHTVTDELRVAPLAKMAEVVEQLPVNGRRNRSILVPVSRVNKITLSTLDFATSLGEDVTALFISDNPDTIRGMTERWQNHEIMVPLVVLENPYRSVVPALVNYIETIDQKNPNDLLIVVLPEFVARHWWEQFLHNQTAWRIKSTLLYRTGVVVVDVPYQLKARLYSAK